MKTNHILRLAIVIACAGAVYACKKSNSGSSTPGQTTANLQVQSDDQTRVNNETDAIANDVNLTLSSPGASSASGASYRGQVETAGLVTIKSLICDASVAADTTDNPRTFTITYNGANCSGTRTRTGTVVVSIPAGQHWRDAGTTITVSIQNLKITRLRDNKTIILNGTHLYTNVSGGSLINLPTLGSITHTITGDSMSITFDDGSQRLWNFARKRVYTYNDGVAITTTGMHSDGTNTGIAAWGTNRYGNSFEAIITQPFVIMQDCNFRLTAGSEEILRPDITINVTFGLDSTGNATSCPGLGAYYFKAAWQGPGGGSGSVILPY